VSMTNPSNRVEVITSVQRRRRWTASEKVRMVEETFEPGMALSLMARQSRRIYDYLRSAPLLSYEGRHSAVFDVPIRHCSSAANASVTVRA
jgi:transposase